MSLSFSDSTFQTSEPQGHAVSTKPPTVKASWYRHAGIRSLKEIAEVVARDWGEWTVEEWEKSLGMLANTGELIYGIWGRTGLAVSLAFAPDIDRLGTGLRLEGFGFHLPNLSRVQKRELIHRGLMSTAEISGRSIVFTCSSSAPTTAARILSELWGETPGLPDDLRIKAKPLTSIYVHCQDFLIESSKSD